MKNTKSFGRLFVIVASVAAMAFALLVLAGCGGASNSSSESSSSSGEQVQLQIFAANSLEKALPQVQELYTQSHPNVTFADSQFKASGDLVEEIEAGASADILITASKSTMDDAEGFIIPETRTTMFGNDLVVCAAENSDIKIKKLTDLKKKNIKKIAIGDSSLVPAGKYANQSLASYEGGQLYTSSEGEGGKYDSSIADKVVLADKVGTCASWVASGNCDVGFVYTSDLYRYDGIKSVYTVPEEFHKPITYPGAVLSDSKNQEVAQDFINFCMTDPDALAVWQDNGFELK